MGSSIHQITKLKQIAVFGQLKVSKLMRELRQLTKLTQEQLATLLNIVYTSDRTNNAHPYLLALKDPLTTYFLTAE